MSTTKIQFLLSPRALDAFYAAAKAAAGDDKRVGYGDAQVVELLVSRNRAKLRLFRRIEIPSYLAYGPGGYLRTETVSLIGRVLVDAPDHPERTVSAAEGLHLTLVNRSLRTWGLIGKTLYPLLRQQGAESEVALLTLHVYDDDDHQVTVHWGGGPQGSQGDLDSFGGYALPDYTHVAYEGRQFPGGFLPGERSRLEVLHNGEPLPEVDLEHPLEKPTVSAVYEGS